MNTPSTRFQSQTAAFDSAAGPAVWLGADKQTRDWVVPFDENECRELVNAAERVQGRTLEGLSRPDFEIPHTAVKLAAVAEELERGSGFVMLRGLPTDSLPRELVETIYWGIGLQMGVGVSQSAAGDRLGHVYDRGTGEKERYYTRGGALEFHMDPVDVVGLLCLHPARSGGASRIVSAGAVHNVIRAERPDLLEVLCRGFHNSRRDHGVSKPSGRVPVFMRGAHGVECYFLPATIRQATTEGCPLSTEEGEAIALVEDVANRPGVFLDMDFRVGDIQFLSNRTILHARTDYVDHDEPDRKRHLLRLWLMMPRWAPRPGAMDFQERVDRAGGGVVPASDPKTRDMKPELELSDFVTRIGVSDVPSTTAETARRVLLASVGAGIAGAGEEGISPLRQLLRARGGAAEARMLVFGTRLPAHAAAQFNGTLCRALDFCDALAPGAHLGSSVVPAALAAAELAGGCSGAELLAAVVVGCEVGARFNLTEPMYDGFDPTGVAVVFGATAAAARILGLSPKQTTNALGLAFNRCGGSFQSNIDGTLAVRVIQGWVAQTGVDCAQLAAVGITGPENFLTGVYGYAHLFGRDSLEPASLTATLGAEWWMNQIVFKKYPSCGATQGLTELTLGLVAEHELVPERIAHVDIRLNPYCHRLVGGEFRVGDNPRVNAQFSAQYCAANAIARGSSKLRHFRPDEIADSTVRELIGRVKCTGDRALDVRGHTAVDVSIATHDGGEHFAQLDIAPGFPGNALSSEQHAERFDDCIDYGTHRLPSPRIDAFLDGVAGLDAIRDARELIDYLIVPSAP